MAALTTTTILPTTTYGAASGYYLGGSADFASDYVKGDGYYGFADGIHTIQTRVTSLIATVKIQATLATTPVESDWVNITTVVNGDGSSEITNGYLSNFTGNYVWIRIAVTNFSSGTINTVILGH
jgi:hypothetical protein